MMNNIPLYLFSNSLSAVLYYFTAMQAYSTLTVCKKVKHSDISITAINEKIKEAEVRLGNIEVNNH